MASSNTDEDENYWPGYVDALTTMTMVLTFIMMVLGVMVFVLSQDAVSSKLGMMARALKIEARQLEKLNQTEIEEALRRAVASKDSGEGFALRHGEQVGAAGGPTSTSAGDAAEGGAQSGANTGFIGNPGLGPVGLPRGMAGPGASSGAQSDGSNPFVSTFTGGLQGDKSAGPGGEYLVTTRSTGVAGPERGTGGRLEPGPGALRFVFERGAIDLPPAVAEALQAYVAAEGVGPMLVEASAVAKEGGPAEARRKADFRAVLIRARLIKLGVDPVRIVVRVRDANQAASLETVDVMKPQTGG